MKQTSVAEIGSRLDATRPSLEWLDEIDRRAAVYLELDPDRAGAHMLTLARENVTLARKAIYAESAVVMALAALQAVWQAEMIEGQQMISQGVKRYRAAERANQNKRQQSIKLQAGWNKKAATIRKKKPHLSATAIAKLIDRKHWNTVRRAISPPKK